MLKKVMSPTTWCGLDIGSQRTKASLISTASQSPELLGVFETPTQGFKNSSVSDLGDLSETVSVVLEGLSRKTGVKIKSVELGIGGDLIESRLSSAIIPLVDKGNKVIAPSDVKRVNHQASLLGLKLEEEILHDFPQFYRVDDDNLAVNPVGLFGRKLEVHLLLILSHINRMNNLSKAVHQAGYDIDQMFFTSLASAQATLSKKMKQDGCILIDIGDQSTDILIFKDGLLKHFDSLRKGGEEITRLLAHELNLTFDLAEDLKKSYATLLSADLDPEEEVLVKKDAAYVPIKRQLICQIVHDEVESLIQEIHKRILDSQLYDQINDGIMVTGGGCLLSGLIERLEAVTKLPVSVGKVTVATHKINNAALFAACIGLSLLGVNRASPPPQADTNGDTPWPVKFANRIKELYQEYF